MSSEAIWTIVNIIASLSIWVLIVIDHRWDKAHAKEMREINADWLKINEDRKANDLADFERWRDLVQNTKGQP